MNMPVYPGSMNEELTTSDKYLYRKSNEGLHLKGLDDKKEYHDRLE